MINSSAHRLNITSLFLSFSFTFPFVIFKIIKFIFKAHTKQYLWIRKVEEKCKENGEKPENFWFRKWQRENLSQTNDDTAKKAKSRHFISLRFSYSANSIEHNNIKKKEIQFYGQLSSSNSSPPPPLTSIKLHTTNKKYKRIKTNKRK